MWTRRNLIKAGMAAGAAAGFASFPFINVSCSSAGRNVIFVICDALRFDRVRRMKEFNGLRQSLTPNLDAFASEGLSFLNAKSPSTFTVVSMLSLMYDKAPTSVLYTGFGTKVDKPHTSIASRLKSAGYVTLLACANDVLSMDSIREGFDDTSQIRRTRASMAKEDKGRGGALMPEISGPRLNSRLSRLLDRHRREIAARPLYLQVHYMDTHQPYNATGFKPLVPFDERIFPRILNTAVEEKRRYYPTRKITVQQAIQCLVEYYDSAAHALDRFLGDLFAQLADRKILDDALVIITADHGEEFADNKETARQHVGHSGPLDEELIHVPLIVRSTGYNGYASGGKTVSNQVSTVRVFNDLIHDYVEVDSGLYSPTRAALHAGTFPDHDVVSALNWYNTETNEASCVSRYKDGYVKYRVFYRNDGSIAREKTFLFGPDGTLAPIALSKEMKQAAAAGLKNMRPPRPIIDKESEDKLRGLGYTNH